SAGVAPSRLANLDKRARAGRWPVAGCWAGVLAPGTAERRDREGPGPVAGTGSGTGPGPGLRLGAAQAGGRPGAGAAVGDRAAIRPGGRDAPPGAGTPRHRVGQGARGGGVPWRGDAGVAAVFGRAR